MKIARKILAPIIALLLMCATVHAQRVPIPAPTPAPPMVKKDNPQDMGPVAIYKLPLFAASGPDHNDGSQLFNGNCGVMASLKAVAYMDPECLKKIITPLANGDFRVTVQVGFGAQYFEITPEVSAQWQAPPVNGMWMTALEKTVAIYYNGGWFHSELNPDNSVKHSGTDGMAPFQVLHNVFGFTDHGVGNSDTPKTPDALAEWIKAGLAKRWSMEVGTGHAVLINPLVSDHFYAIYDVQKDATGVWQIFMFSPWGDFFNVQISASDFLLQFQEIAALKYEK